LDEVLRCGGGACSLCLQWTNPSWEFLLLMSRHSYSGSGHVAPLSELTQKTQPIQRWLSRQNSGYHNHSMKVVQSFEVALAIENLYP